MIIKLKSKDELVKIGYRHQNNIWVSKEEAYRRNETVPIKGYYSVVSDRDNIYGKVITNEKKESSNVIKFVEKLEDKAFLKIFSWAMDTPITKQTNPEYFL